MINLSKSTSLSEQIQSFHFPSSQYPDDVLFYWVSQLEFPACIQQQLLELAWFAVIQLDIYDYIFVVCTAMCDRRLVSSSCLASPWIHLVSVKIFFQSKNCKKHVKLGDKVGKAHC